MLAVERGINTLRTTFEADASEKPNTVPCTGRGHLRLFLSLFHIVGTLVLSFSRRRRRMRSRWQQHCMAASNALRDQCSGSHLVLPFPRPRLDGWLKATFCFFTVHVKKSTNQSRRKRISESDKERDREIERQSGRKKQRNTMQIKEM